MTEQSGEHYRWRGAGSHVRAAPNLRERRRVARGICAAALVVGAFTATVLPATSAIADGVQGQANVVALDNGDIVLDLSASRGASVGQVVQLWRPLRLRHPVTGKIVTDRFRIGSLRLTQVGENLSLATPTDALHRPAQPGDIVTFADNARALTASAPTPVQGAAEPAARTHAAAPTASGPTGSAWVAPAPGQASGPPAPIASGSAQGACTPAAEDAEARELSAMFEALSGSDPVARIRAYESYVRAKPTSRYSRVLYEEAQALRRLVTRPQEAAPGQAPGDQSGMAARFTPFDDVLAGVPIDVGIELAGSITGSVLHIRSQGDKTYTSLPMNPAGAGYYRVRVPGELLRAPSAEYFIEATSPAGVAVPVAGDASAPKQAAIRDVPQPEPPPQRIYSASILTDYADYNRLRHNDWASQTEGWFGIRFRDVGMRAMRSGFGVYRGAGGSIQELDVEGKGPRAIGLTYGYLEAEVGVSDFVSFLGRGVVGLRDSGIAGGGQLLIRIGNDRKTNLVMGGEVLDGVGIRGITQLELLSLGRFPILLRTEVTNQPAGVTDLSPRPADGGQAAGRISTANAEVGARAIVQVGYRIIPDLTIAVRGSYQGRTINHAGPGVGAGVTYEW